MSRLYQAWGTRTERPYVDPVDVETVREYLAAVLDRRVGDCGPADAGLFDRYADRVRVEDADRGRELERLRTLFRAAAEPELFRRMPDLPVVTDVLAAARRWDPPQAVVQILSDRRQWLAAAVDGPFLATLFARTATDVLNELLGHAQPAGRCAGRTAVTLRLFVHEMGMLVGVAAVALAVPNGAPAPLPPSVAGCDESA
jgi:hypothetical protein